MAERDRHLPLTEGKAHTPTGAASDPADHTDQTASEADIRRLVVAFYERGRTDPLIGPIFGREVTDWEAHFDRMCDFWSSAVLKTGRYSGRPAMQHFGLGLTPEHFDRWLGLWEETALAELGAAKADPFVDMGRRMARAMLNITGMVG